MVSAFDVDPEVDVKITLAAFSLLVASLAMSASGATFIPPTDRGMIHRSHAIVVGEPITSYSQLNRDGGIETVTLFSVSETIVGELISSHIEIHEPGGSYDGRVMYIPGVPRFQPGQQSILFLRRTPLETWAVTDLALGKFDLMDDAYGQTIAVREPISALNTDGTVHA